MTKRSSVKKVVKKRSKMSGGKKNRSNNKKSKRSTKRSYKKRQSGSGLWDKLKGSVRTQKKDSNANSSSKNPSTSNPSTSNSETPKKVGLWGKLKKSVGKGTGEKKKLTDKQIEKKIGSFFGLGAVKLTKKGEKRGFIEGAKKLAGKGAEAAAEVAGKAELAYEKDEKVQEAALLRAKNQAEVRAAQIIAEEENNDRIQLAREEMKKKRQDRTEREAQEEAHQRAVEAYKNPQVDSQQTPLQQNSNQQNSNQQNSNQQSSNNNDIALLMKKVLRLDEKVEDNTKILNQLKQ